MNYSKAAEQYLALLGQTQTPAAIARIGRSAEAIAAERGHSLILLSDIFAARQAIERPARLLAALTGRRQKRR